MFNKSAADAYLVATNLIKIYTRLGVARDTISLALDEAPLGFDDDQFKRLNDLRNSISKEMGLVFDLSKREAHRICNTQLTTAPHLIWKENIIPDKPGLWAYMNQDGEIFYHDTSKAPESPVSWKKGRWCFLGPVPEINLDPNHSTTLPDSELIHSPADDNAVPLASFEEIDLDSCQIPAPDPTFIQVHNSF